MHVLYHQEDSTFWGKVIRGRAVGGPVRHLDGELLVGLHIRRKGELKLNLLRFSWMVYQCIVGYLVVHN